VGRAPTVRPITNEGRMRKTKAVKARERRAHADKKKARAAWRRYYYRNQERLLNAKAAARGGARRKPANPDDGEERRFRVFNLDARSGAVFRRIAFEVRGHIAASPAARIPGDDNRSAEKLLDDYEKDGIATLRRLRAR
jgi:hypothetical protein